MGKTALYADQKSVYAIATQEIYLKSKNCCATVKLTINETVVWGGWEVWEVWSGWEDARK
ncbi:MAG: hypothetical protein QNJ74_05745 [Trichodesmium sp. MO_231.B1]|nr:hypothetical protein [Trichodesmium sp. MO_231.B1]